MAHMSEGPSACHSGSTRLKDKFPPNQYEKANQQRKEELHKIRWRCLTVMKSLHWILLLSASCLVLFYIFTSLDTPTLKQERVAVLKKTSWMAQMSEGPCTCQHGSTMVNKFPRNQYEKANQQRKEELEKHKTRTKSELSKLLLALPNSPLQFPIQGVNVKPLHSSPIPGLGLHARDQNLYKVTLTVTKGTLSSDYTHKGVNMEGNGTAMLTLTSSSLLRLNTVLETVSYKSTFYHIHTPDLASFSFENHTAIFPIIIRQPQPPVMFHMGNDINSQVTITIKTFVRYHKLNPLLSSIRKFYPKIPVIIADDSFKPRKLSGENIFQYIMPPAQGWFAGRNLAVSQVTTKYFLWADDDFLFTENTKIEKFVEVMEAFPELDVVGGSVNENQFYFTLDYDEGDESEGGCLSRTSGGKFHTLPGYPQCFLVSGVVNFFLARTDILQKSRFDPLLTTVAHSEWFMDGLGSMMVASCANISVGHQRSGASTVYQRYRHQMGAKFKAQLHFFKNSLKCIKFG